MEPSIREPKVFDNRYQTIRCLGEGANGKTYLTKDLKTGAMVALKSLKLKAAENFKSLELFEREVQTLSSISIVGVPKFIDSHIAENADEQSYIVQQYIDAPSLLDSLKEMHRFPEALVLEIMNSVAKILNILHTQYTPPIIHRDIKPSNILCKIDNKSQKIASQLYLIDFGAVANPQKSSGSSTVAGTFGYMSPEQYVGTVSIQSDIYSLGTTAIHLLTGIPPYEMKSDVFKLEYRTEIRKYAPETSCYLLELLDKMIAPEASDRPQSIGIIMQAINNIRHGVEPFSDVMSDDVNLTHMKKRKQENTAKELLAMQTAKADGWIRAFRPHYHYLLAEYTFEANGKTWCGVNIQNGFDITKFPCQCVVQYNPEDPSINSMFDYKRQY